MQDSPDGSERLRDEYFRGWTRLTGSKTQLRDRFPKAQAETTRIVEQSGASIRSLLSRSTLQETEVKDAEHPVPGVEAVDPLRVEEPAGPESLSVEL